MGYIGRDDPGARGNLRLAATQDISSTEKLLRVIRDSQAAPPLDPGGPDSPSPNPFRRIGKAFLATRLAHRRRSSIGVHIASREIKLVRMARTFDGGYILKDHLSLPYPEDAGKGSPRFPRFLRSALEEFGGVSKREQVWCSISLEGVDVGHVTIPKVPRSQIANAVTFTVKKENPYDEADRFLDFEVQSEVLENGIARLRVLYYVAPRAGLEQIRSHFSKAGVQLTGVSVGPFAVQNLFRTGWVPAGDAPVGSLYIGWNWSRIDVFSKGNLMLTRRGIKAGVNSMIETLMESFNERVHEWSARRAAVAPGSDEHELKMLQSEGAPTTEIDSSQARKILFSLNPELPQLQKGDAGFDLSRTEKFAMVEPAVERLVRQVERTFEHYTKILGLERVSRIFVPGGVVLYPELEGYIADELGIKPAVIDPMDPRIPGVEDGVPPETEWERISYTLAAGLALSDNGRTPNLLLPYEAKERIARIRRLNTIIIAAFLLIMATAGTYHVLQKRTEGKRQAEVAALESEISRRGALLDQKLILAVAGKVSAKKAAIEEAKRRYVVVAVLGDISSRTPDVIRLLSAKASLGRAAAATEKQGQGAAKGGEKKGGGTERPKTIALEGLVFGDPKQFDSSLAGYLMKLEASPLLRNPRLEKTQLQRYKEKEVLRFSLALEVI